jgi:hypothetical protein
VHQILRRDQSSIIKTKTVLNNNKCIKFSAVMKARSSKQKCAKQQQQQQQQLHQILRRRKKLDHRNRNAHYVFARKFLLTTLPRKNQKTQKNPTPSPPPPKKTRSEIFENNK